MDPMELVTPAIGLMFWTCVVFSLLLILLKKFAWKPILSAVDARNSGIEEALALAKKTKDEMANLQADNKMLLQEARSERDQMLKEAREMKNAIISEAKNTAKEEADKMIASAKAVIENEKAGAISELKSTVGSLSVDIAEKVLRAELKDAELLREKIQQLEGSLKKDFNISRPKIAVLGLNPHTGDKGVIGKEDDQITRPLIQELSASGHLVYGPYAADSFFGHQTHLQFDAILAIYHDQGLIPFKTLTFGAGVNFTAGLSKVRTSPDHGTAFEIAGKGLAETESFRNAMFLARNIYFNRQREKITYH